MAEAMRLRTATVKAWQVSEGDLSPSGARVVSVQRDPSRGHVRIGFSDGRALDVAGERCVVIVLPGRSGAIFLRGTWRARERLT
jgi:hypothetical protein